MTRKRELGLWSDPSVPHDGWKCVEMEYLPKDKEFLCEMCLARHPRLVQIMAHPDYPKRLAVGKDCAARMEGGDEAAYAAAEEREKRLKRVAWGRGIKVGKEYRFPVGDLPPRYRAQQSPQPPARPEPAADEAAPELSTEPAVNIPPANPALHDLELRPCPWYWEWDEFNRLQAQAEDGTRFRLVQPTVRGRWRVEFLPAGREEWVLGRHLFDSLPEAKMAAYAGYLRLRGR